MVIEMKPRTRACTQTTCIQQVRAKLAQVTGLLREPDTAAMDACAPVLEEATALLASFDGMPYDGIRSDLDALRTDIGRVQELLAQAARFHGAWAQILGAVSGGYTPSGASALDVRARVSLEG